jgi:hypothetical protein
MPNKTRTNETMLKQIFNEAELGVDTAALAAAIKEYNPTSKWIEVE